MQPRGALTRAADVYVDRKRPELTDLELSVCQCSVVSEAGGPQPRPVRAHVCAQENKGGAGCCATGKAPSAAAGRAGSSAVPRRLVLEPQVPRGVSSGCVRENVCEPTVRVCAG